MAFLSLGGLLGGTSTRSRCLGIDIGSKSIKAALLSGSEHKVVLENTALIPLDHDPKISPEERRKRVSQALEKLLKNKGMDVDHIAVSLPGQSILTRYVEILEVSKDKIEQTIKYEAQQQIPFSLDEVIWDYHLFYKTKGTRREALLVAAKRTVVEEMLKTIGSLGRQPALMDINVLAFYNMLKFNKALNEDKLTAIIDIGARATQIALSRGSDIWVRCFPLAGNRFTEALESKFQLSTQEAEKLKLSNLVDREEIQEALKPGMEDLVAEIRRSIEIYHLELEYDKNLSASAKKGEGIQAGGAVSSGIGIGRVEEVILSGGGSLLKGLDRFFESRLSVPVRRPEVTKKIENRLVEAGGGERGMLQLFFGPAIGTALRGLVRCPIEIDFLKDINWQKVEKQQVVFYRTVSVALLAMILGFGIFVANRELGFKKGLIEEREGLVATSREFSPMIEEVEKEISALEDKTALFMKISQKRSIWLDVFLEVERKLPHDVWLTSFTARGSLETLGQGDITLSGKALSYQEINRFVSDLKGTPLFKDVRPIASSLIKRGKGSDEIVEFTITMGLAS